MRYDSLWTAQKISYKISSWETATPYTSRNQDATRSRKSWTHSKWALHPDQTVLISMLINPQFFFFKKKQSLKRDSSRLSGISFSRSMSRVFWSLWLPSNPNNPSFSWTSTSPCQTQKIRFQRFVVPPNLRRSARPFQNSPSMHMHYTLHVTTYSCQLLKSTATFFTLQVRRATPGYQT